MMEEVFKTIPGHPKYAVSPTGRVLSYSTGIIRKPYKNPKDGYWRITLYDGSNQRSTIEIHRLVAEAGIPKPEGNENWQVNHIDHDKDNNTVPNLEGVSPRENIVGDFKTNYRDISKTRLVYTYEITKNGEGVATVKGMARVADIVGVSETRCSYACKLEIPTSTGYIIKKVNTECKEGYIYVFYDVYKDGELIAKHLRPDEAVELTGVSYRRIRYSAQYNKPVKDGYLFVKNKKN